MINQPQLNHSPFKLLLNFMHSSDFLAAKRYQQPLQEMKYYKSPLTIFGLILIGFGLILNVRMFFINAWPTYLFLIAMGIGFIFLFIDWPLRKSNRYSKKVKFLIQIAIVTTLTLSFWVKQSFIDDRAKIIIAPEEYEGPFAIIYNMNGYPPLEKHGSDWVAILPENGVLITSTRIEDLPDLIETYIVNNKLKYGERVIAKLGAIGSITSSKCDQQKMVYYIGVYSSKPNDKIEFNRSEYINSIYDSLCQNE